MNILHHKSWHVRTKKNIERVRRDEEKAAEEEKEKQRRIALAEQEARTSLLRDRAKKRPHELLSKQDNELMSKQEDQRAVTESKQPRHMNFFEEFELGTNKSGTNKEYEAEKHAEQEKREKDYGLLTYLGQSAIESQTAKPWYLTKAGRSKEEAAIDKEKRKQDILDPLHKMNEYLQRTRKHHEPDHHHSDRDRHKKYKTRTDKDKPVASLSAKSSSGPKTIEQLRAERLKREAEERMKMKIVIAKSRGETVESDSKTRTNEYESDDRTRAYNSQYNPEFVRKPKHKSDRKRYY